MIRSFRAWWSRWRFSRWRAQNHRRYVARRAIARADYLAWLEARELPGTPKTEILPQAWIRPPSAIVEGAVDEP